MSISSWKRVLWNIVKPAILVVVRGAVREKLDKVHELDENAGLKDQIAESVQDALRRL